MYRPSKCKSCCENSAYT